jgi:hypothetical protein
VVLGDGRWFGPYRDSETTLRALASGIHYALGKRSPMTFIHAGAVVIEGRAFVFPGDGDYGKSVLVNRLVEEGAGYLSDEWAVVSPEGRLFPLSKPIRLRGPERDSYVRPRGVSTPGGFACAGFVLTRFVPGATWNPRPMTQGEAILQSLDSTLRCGRNPDGTIEALTRATADAACVAGDRGDGEPSIAALIQLTDDLEDRGITQPDRLPLKEVAR